MIIKEFSKKQSEILKFINEPIDRLMQMKRMGKNIDEIKHELASVTNMSIADVENVFTEIAKENYDFSEQYYNANNIKQIPFAQNISLQRLIKSQAKQTLGTMINLAQTTAKSLSYQSLLDKAITASSSGLIDYNTAIRQVVKQTAIDGMGYIDLSRNGATKRVQFDSGYKRRLDTSVRQNVLFGIKSTNQGVSDLTGQEFGADGYEIDLHSGARPSHRPMQGKQYAIGEAKVVDGVLYPSFAEVESLLTDYGCLHFKFSILLGVNEPTYSDAEIKRQNERDRELIEFNGQSKTRYEWTQEQRRLETAVRRHKDVANMAKASGDDFLRREAQGKINDITKRYDLLSEAVGLPSKRERMTVSGFRGVKTQAKLLTTQIKGIKSSNGIAITQVSQHAIDQAENRGITDLLTIENLTNTLTNPLNIGKIKVDQKGRPSQQFLGDVLTLGVNNETGVLTTVWETSSNRIKKYGGNKK